MKRAESMPSVKLNNKTRTKKNKNNQKINDGSSSVNWLKTISVICKTKTNRRTGERGARGRGRGGGGGDRAKKNARQREQTIIVSLPLPLSQFQFQFLSHPPLPPVYNHQKYTQNQNNTILITFPLFPLFSFFFPLSFSFLLLVIQFNQPIYN